MSASREPLILAGVVGSPYSRKMRAALRFRRIPFRWVGAMGPQVPGLPKPPLPLMPILYFPLSAAEGSSQSAAEGSSQSAAEEWEATSDSTFMLQRLEGEYEDRSIVPGDGTVAFLDRLVEDYADEWVTKQMFHYRWAVQENVDNANKMLPRWNLGIPEEMAAGFGDTFGQRQIDRLWVVGSNDVTRPLIEGSYERLLDILERHLREHNFVLGGRPGAGDFALFGQLSQLVQVEPSSQRIARERAPRVVAWCDIIEDISGLEVSDDDWVGRDVLPRGVSELLHEIGRTYAPFLLANADALESGAERVETEIDGAAYTQKPFPYQGKCLRWLREAYEGLSEDDRKGVDAAVVGTGCEPLFA
jgi:glutathione S-transferase